MQNLLVISSLLQCKIHSKNNFSQILGSLGGIQYSDLILTGTCNAAAAGSVAVMGDSDGEWVMGGGRRVMVVVMLPSPSLSSLLRLLLLLLLPLQVLLLYGRQRWRCAMGNGQRAAVGMV